ncbi:hypothetical protein [Gilvimarinus sp. DA14]|uniref:hypothetical protein n=1 Tax=Gilvimarinus sp. DA14 TaxID=2956798 RepID=UPI0020B68941|nr:hypothetical protein [Gilvimarinus sp. DA14]UTF59360.1 hypothetical protein NHM04_12855 [Gilvimarinus sp. DA14]
MQYSKPMIDLILELRRRVPSQLKPGIKLANPEVLQELADFYPHCKETVTRALIKELFQMAGDDWMAELEPKSEAKPEKSHQVKVYRGQVTLTERPNPGEEEAKKKDKPVRMYRGQVVYR